MTAPPRRTVQLEAVVRGARGLVSLAGEEEPITNCTASLAFLGGEPVESEPVSETAEPTFDLSTLHTFKAQDANCATLLATPLVVTVTEGADKQTLGTVTVPLEPLMRSAGIPEQWLPLVGEDGTPTSGEVLVGVVAAMALMSEEDYEESTTITLAVEGMHKLPARWGVDEAASEADHGFTYTATCEFLGESFTYEGAARVPPPPAEEAEAAPRGGRRRG